MKKHLPLLLLLAFLLVGCKKNSVDSESTQSFRSSINDMTTSLSTLQQFKFNEALYILKTFGVDAEGDANEMNALRKLLSGKKVPEIFALADQVASQNGVEWSSTGPPSLGDMNIFDDAKAKEHDPNEVDAAGLDVIVKPLEDDGVTGPLSLQVIPRLTDKSGRPINFEGAALETTMDVYSGGTRIYSSKNLMLNNNFRGFNIRFRNFSPSKIVDGKIDITVSVKTTKQTYKMSKIGQPVNPDALKKPEDSIPASLRNDSTSTEMLPESSDPNATTELNTSNPTNNVTPAKPVVVANPKATVQKFLNNLNAQNLKGAYDVSANPSWGSYDNFSNSNSGFGSVKSVSIKNITPTNSSDKSASVNATYDVTDKNGKTTPLKVTFGLKNVNGEWKISSYKIN